MIKEFFAKLVRMDFEKPKTNPFMERMAQEKARADKVRQEMIKRNQENLRALQQKHKEELETQAGQEAPEIESKEENPAA